jgi:hypothetical protein
MWQRLVKRVPRLRLGMTANSMRFDGMRFDSLRFDNAGRARL